MMAGRPYRRYHVLTMARMEMWRHFDSRCAILTGAFYAGLLDGLLGVAGMMKLYEIDISPVDHSRKFPA